MSLTVKELISLPELRTRSLTPGVGEKRVISWAHSCELPDPWLWVGEGALVMTTGLAVPAEAEAQRSYIEHMAKAGIAGIAIGEKMSAPPLSESTLALAAELDFPVLSSDYEVRFITIAQTVARAGNRIRGKQLLRVGSILLGSLADETIPSELAARLVAAHDLTGPYLLCTWKVDDVKRALDSAQTALSATHTPALFTIKDRHALLLLPHSADTTLTELTDGVGTLGASAPFTDFNNFHTALRQAQVALARGGRSERAGLLRFDGGVSSLFLPDHPEQLRAIAEQVLGPLQEWDAQKGTPFMHTLHVFLAVNRSWVRAAELLFVHRQTLVARVARIEAILRRDLTSMEDAAECWFGVRAAVACGELDPLLEEPADD